MMIMISLFNYIITKICQPVTPVAELTYQEDIDAPRLPQQLKCRRSAIWLMTHTVIMNPHYVSGSRNIGLDLGSMTTIT